MGIDWIKFSFNGGELGPSFYESGQKQVKFKYPCPTSNSICNPIRAVINAGTYKFECVGAVGGSGKFSSGGLGGYSVGAINFSIQTTLFIYIGGKGSTISGTSGTISKGGFNGGGNGMVGDARLNAGGGGGATDIRVSLDSISNRVIVGGGGGGSGGTSDYGDPSPDNLGGNGGGEIGISGTSQSGDIHYGTGGTQSSPGICNNYQNKNLGWNNVGGTGTSAGSSSGGGGGGGYYGGGGGRYAGGGGGSGFVGSMLSVFGVEKKTTPFSNNDNGYAIITLLSESSKKGRCSSKCSNRFLALLFIFQQMYS